MPSASDPKVVVRLSVADYVMLDRLAESVGVSTSGLAREAMMRAARDVAREVAAGRLVLRGRNVAGLGGLPGLQRGVVSGAQVVVEPESVVAGGASPALALRMARGLQ